MGGSTAVPLFHFSSQGLWFFADDVGSVGIAFWIVTLRSILPPGSHYIVMELLHAEDGGLILWMKRLTGYFLPPFFFLPFF